MAALGQIFRFEAVPTRPRRFGLRLLCYLGVSISAWVFPPWGAALAGLCVLLLGRRIDWLAWIAKLGGMWIFVLAPLLVVPAAYAGENPPIDRDWIEASYRCITFLILLAGSHWLTCTTTVFEIRTALDRIFGIFGRQAASALSLVGALALCFIPWVLAEAAAVREAGELRGVPRKRILLVLRSLTIPLFVRIIQKARHTADAVDLRGS